MQLLLIRHAIAEDRFEFARTGQSDYYRPLTERGRARMARGATGLRTLVPDIDVLATSPLTRAVQTAERPFSSGSANAVRKTWSRPSDTSPTCRTGPPGCSPARGTTSPW